MHILLFLKDKKLININDEVQTSINHRPEITTIEEREVERHKVLINDGSRLHHLFGREIMVNSHHNYAIPEVVPPLKVVATEESGIIEGIEVVRKDQFMVGVQWHPEWMDNMNILFEEFINEAEKYHHIKKKMKGGNNNGTTRYDKTTTIK
jgi:gamma-glutamyl-gamma-aminobutyrate hydrolase PuuD